MAEPLHALPDTLRDCAIAIVGCADTAGKAALAETVAASWQDRSLAACRASARPSFPSTPGRPSRPILLAPSAMPRRRAGSTAGLVALVHSLVHIELNAIDMTWDLIARFADVPLPRAFLDQAVTIGLEEARHFVMMNARLEELGARYGDLPAHAGLWEAAQETGHDLLARLAIVPLVLEARGLDVSPAMIAQIERAGQPALAASLEVIYRDEIGHVAFGARWFKHLCAERGLKPEPTFQDIVRRHFRGGLKPPFNDAARAEAGLTPGFYRPLLPLPHGDT
jgi:uncharacterized ferritin-like protein (DUF455 family)